MARTLTDRLRTGMRIAALAGVTAACSAFGTGCIGAAYETSGIVNNDPVQYAFGRTISSLENRWSAEENANKIADAQREGAQTIANAINNRQQEAPQVVAKGGVYGKDGQQVQQPQAQNNRGIPISTLFDKSKEGKMGAAIQLAYYIDKDNDGKTDVNRGERLAWGDHESFYRNATILVMANNFYEGKRLSFKVRDESWIVLGEGDKKLDSSDNPNSYQMVSAFSIKDLVDGFKKENGIKEGTLLATNLKGGAWKLNDIPASLIKGGTQNLVDTIFASLDVNQDGSGRYKYKEATGKDDAAELTKEGVDAIKAAAADRQINLEELKFEGLKKYYFDFYLDDENTPREIKPVTINYDKDEPE